MNLLVATKTTVESINERILLARKKRLTGILKTQNMKEDRFGKYNIHVLITFIKLRTISTKKKNYVL